MCLVSLTHSPPKWLHPTVTICWTVDSYRFGWPRSTLHPLHWRTQYFHKLQECFIGHGILISKQSLVDDQFSMCCPLHPLMVQAIMTYAKFGPLDQYTKLFQSLRASATFCMLWRPNGTLISLSISMKNGNHYVVFVRRLLLKHTFDTDYTKLHLRTRDYTCVTYCTVMFIFWWCAFSWRNARWPQMTLVWKNGTFILTELHFYLNTNKEKI